MEKKAMSADEARSLAQKATDRLSNVLRERTLLLQAGEPNLDVHIMTQEDIDALHRRVDEAGIRALSEEFDIDIDPSLPIRKPVLGTSSLIERNQ